jgi:hypothetical protein
LSRTSGLAERGNVENGFDREWQEILENIQDVVYLVTGQSGQTMKVTVVDARHTPEFANQKYMLEDSCRYTTPWTAYIFQTKADFEIAVVLQDDGVKTYEWDFEDYAIGTIAAMSHLLYINQLEERTKWLVSDFNKTFAIKLESNSFWIEPPDPSTTLWVSAHAKQVFQ